MMVVMFGGRGGDGDRDGTNLTGADYVSDGLGWQ